MEHVGDQFTLYDVVRVARAPTYQPIVCCVFRGQIKPLAMRQSDHTFQRLSKSGQKVLKSCSAVSKSAQKVLKSCSAVFDTGIWDVFFRESFEQLFSTICFYLFVGLMQFENLTRGSELRFGENFGWLEKRRLRSPCLKGAEQTFEHF